MPTLPRREIYGGHTIYNIPSQARTVRVTQIGYDMIALSNTPTTEQIHSISIVIAPRRCPSPARRCWPSTITMCPCSRWPGAWARSACRFLRAAPSTSSGFALPIQADSTIIASLRWTGSLHLRVEEIAPSEDKAA